MTERTLVIIKPDGVRRGLVDEIKRRISGSGLRITASRKIRLTRELAEKLYEQYIGKEFFEPLVEFMMSGDIVAMIVEGDRAISRTREMLGPTDSRLAPKGTIRGDFGRDNRHNVMHASDSVESARREISIFF